MRKFRKVPILGTAKVDPYDFDKVYNIEDIVPFDCTPEEIPEVLDMYCFEVANPCNLDAACRMYLKECKTLRSVLNQIDRDYGDSTGIFPLAALDWKTQQDIFERWYDNRRQKR